KDQMPPSDKSLVRFLDVQDVEPGKTYKYRITVILHNPNYKRFKEVDHDKLARVELLYSRPVETMPVTVPADLHFYVVDEMFAKHKIVSGATRAVGPESGIVVQVHRWAPHLFVNNTRTPFGDWTIAERVFVKPGEYIGKNLGGKTLDGK